MKKYTEPYIEQWNRLIRLREGLDKFSVATEANFEDAIDAFTSFVIQCYSLKDWLINSGYDKNVIEKSIKDDRFLALCRDLANTQKHQRIDLYTPVNSFVGNDFGVSTPISKSYDPIAKHEFFGVRVWEFGKPIPILEMADYCLKAWSRVISSRT